MSPRGGLGDIVLHPGYATNHLVYFSHVESKDGRLGAVVTRARLVLDEAGGSSLQDLGRIWEQMPKNRMPQREDQRDRRPPHQWSHGSHSTSCGRRDTRRVTPGADAPTSPARRRRGIRPCSCAGIPLFP